MQTRFSRKMLVIGGSVAVLVVIAAMIGLRVADSGTKMTEDPPPLVTVTAPTVGPVATVVSINGTSSARNELPLGIDGEGGRIAAVLVDVGDKVRRGQRLAVLDTSVLAPQVARLEASLLQARADADLARADWNRAQGVEASGALSKEAIEQRRSKLATTTAQVAVAEAQLKEMRARLARAEVRAPLDGVVLTRNAEIGQIASAGSEPLFRLAQDGAVELRGKVAEQDLPHLAVGQAATVRIAGLEKPFKGTVRLLGATIDQASRLGEVRIALDPDPNLRPGAFARGEVLVSDAARAVVPQTAVLADRKGTYVYIIGPDMKVARRDVRVADTTSNGVVIASGLEGHEQIVVTAGAFLREGETVRTTT
ncbi:MAG: efflux RND transporter periplasmic adaptor subunit [Steroidobacteraceae bacterium]|nr:efflux RND transporter periplasmic adaptor subunit [Steroidobacteraceae bacterium]